MCVGLVQQLAAIISLGFSSSARLFYNAEVTNTRMISYQPVFSVKGNVPFVASRSELVDTISEGPI